MNLIYAKNSFNLAIFKPTVSYLAYCKLYIQNKIKYNINKQQNN